MKKVSIKLVVISILLLISFSLSSVFAANNVEELITKTEYSKEYKEWLELSDQEKSKVLEPRKYDIQQTQTNSNYIKSIQNIFKTAELLKGTLQTTYDLRNVIPENVVVKNQMQTNSCWVFATIGSLETNLALEDKLANKNSVLYDFSEKHMNYATTRASFLNNQINKYGFNKKVSDGGNFFLAQAYLTNGMGAINEKDLPFENSEAQIDISQIQNKDITATLIDTKEFTVPLTSQIPETINEMKQHITNYGGIYAGIYGAQLLSDNYNNETGAIYCSNRLTTPSNHAVTIVGWDDNYSKDNFNEKNKPTANGAWIIKNSWGTEQTEKILELKKQIYDNNTVICNNNGWNSADQIPTDFVLTNLKASYGESKVKVSGDSIIIEVANQGFMYVSYEDANVYKDLAGIQNAEPTKNYGNIYQNDILGYSNGIQLSSSEETYLANVFSRDSSKEEQIDRISIYTTKGYTCKVFINPNGDSKTLNDLQEVKLSAGDSETIEPGYHSLEFAEPVTLTGDSFVVVVKILDSDYTKYIALESVIKDTSFANVVVNEGESFISIQSQIEQNIWQDTATFDDETLRGNLCIKAYTTKEKQEIADLNGISISKEPTKTSYIEGENFDKTGMIVSANYTDTTSKEITNYTINNGNNLTKDQKSVTISYTENNITKSAIQNITVNTSGDVDEPKQPKLSDFTKTNAATTKSNVYYKSQDLENPTAELTIEINQINLGDQESKYDYYYYLSGTQGDKNITNWKNTEIKKQSDGTYSIVLNINSNDIENYNEIIKSDKLYVYIKEVAKIDQSQKEQINAIQVELKAETEFYLDGQKVGGIDDIIKPNNNNNNNSNNQNNGTDVDNTKSNIMIPKAGIIVIQIAFILLVVISGAFAYWRYKNIDR